MIAQRQALHDAQQAFHSGVTQFFTHEQNKYSAAKAALQEADQRYDRTLKAKQADLKDQMNFAFRTAKNNLDALGKEESAVSKQISATKGEVASTQGNERNRQGRERVGISAENAKTAKGNLAVNQGKLKNSKANTTVSQNRENRLASKNLGYYPDGIPMRSATQSFEDYRKNLLADYQAGKLSKAQAMEGFRRGQYKGPVKGE